MSRSKLIKELKNKHPKLNQSEIKTIFNVFSESITTALKNGNDVEIRGFGNWKLKKLKENYNARNPSSNELIYRPERVRVRFKASKKLNKLINE